MIAGLLYLGCLILLFVVPPPYSTLLLGLMIAASVGIGLRWRHRAASDAPSERVKLSAAPFLTLIELSLVIVTALAVNSRFLTSPIHERINGYEFEWLTSSAHFAHLSLREYGYIPLWQPYHEFGEPLIDNPFSFVFNPLSAGPTLLFGGVQGTKISAALYGGFAGLGGWFLARVLGLGLAARLLLGLLLIGKGNMLAMIGSGYYQLGVTQAYFPWVIGAAVAVLRHPGARWAVVLLAVMITLMFWGGNIWYTLPTIFAVVLLTVFHILPSSRNSRPDLAAVRRMLLAGLLTAGLSAVTLLPIFVNRDFIGRHIPEQEAGWAVDPILAAGEFFDGSRALYARKLPYFEPQFYYSYAVPLWFAAFALLLLPPIPALGSLQRSALRQSWRVWAVALSMLIGAFIWGVGGNPIMIALYDIFPLLARWRFVGRALAVASFWLVVLMALRLDSLWRLVFDPGWSSLQLPPKTVRAVQINLALGLTALALIASIQVNQATAYFARTAPRETRDSACLSWLRQQFPDRELAVWRHGYDVTTAFLDHRIRQIGIEADYAAVPLPSTIGALDLTRAEPEYGLGWYGADGEFLSPEGFAAVTDSPRWQGNTCLWRNADALRYAFTVPLLTLETLAADQLSTTLTTPVQRYERLPDRIRLDVAADPAQTLVLTIQERAYPGWAVWVDGDAATLQSVGGQVGVLLPPSRASHTVEFAYRPPLLFIGGAVTLTTWAVCTLYLLRADERLRRRRERGRAQ